MILLNDTELYIILDQLGYSDCGKRNVLVELNAEGLIRLEGGCIRGCAIDEQPFPGHLFAVKDMLLLHKQQRMKKKSELLLSRAKSMANL